MKKSDYWQDRFKLVEEASHKEAIKTYKEIEPAFMKAQREINSQIQVWYGRFAENNEMTLAEARKTLNANELKEFRWDVEDFIKYGKENAINQKWMKELENASAKFHVTRLESLLLRNQQTMEALFGNEVDQVDQMARRIITEGYYKSIYEVQKGFGLGFDISGIDDKELNFLVSKPWAGDGKNFSSRIWQRKGQMVNDLQKELTRNLILGKAPDEAIKNLERFVDKKIKNTRNAAGRLVMTESAYFHSLSQKKAFDELDVEEYEIVATLDSRTSEICQDMDGKHFPMEDYQAGITAPPFHVYCRSTTVPYFDDEFTLKEKRAARDKEGKTFYVPGDMKYKDWKIKVENSETGYNDEKEPDFIILDKNLINEFQIKSNEIYSTLSKSEREALSEYTQGGYLDINADLASGIESYYTESLNSSIDKFTVDSNIITYRGTSEKYYKGYKVGDIFEGKVFYSTSVSEDQAKAFADDITKYSEDGSKGVLVEIRVPKGSKALYIGENTDYDFNEYELLLSNKAKYKIKNFDNDKIVLEMIL